MGTIYNENNRNKMGCLSQFKGYEVMGYQTDS